MHYITTKVLTKSGHFKDMGIWTRYSVSLI